MQAKHIASIRKPVKDLVTRRDSIHIRQISNTVFLHECQILLAFVETNKL